MLIDKFPILSRIPNERIQAVRDNFEVVDIETRKVVEAKRRELADAIAAGEELKGRDLISLLRESCSQS